ncbi:hypothetical protein C8R44DRAFT_979270 [Mycena epipterygia]|nr:hypothetical protein C8R44DRAFT_979270 [Mycena epipterygia]
MSSTPVTHLVSFLTRPLMRSHNPATIVSLQLCLHTALSASTQSSLLLSASCPPPPQIQRACILSGIRWADWIRLLSGGIDLQILISESSLSVQLGTMPPRIIWDAVSLHAPKPRSPAFIPVGTPFGARLRATLASARTRRGAALNPTRIPTLLSSTDSDADSDSDSDSDISDSGCSFTSASSSTSVATTASAKPVVDHTKTDVTRYMYQGGSTQVMSGGVMLGAAAPPKVKRGPAVFSNGRSSASFTRKTGVSSADSWRKSS